MHLITDQRGADAVFVNCVELDIPPDNYQALRSFSVDTTAGRVIVQKDTVFTFEILEIS